MTSFNWETRAKGLITDEECLQHNTCIQFWLSACYCYDVLNEPIMSDKTFDNLYQFIYKEWDNLKHPHKSLINKELLKSSLGTDFTKWPERLKSATLFAHNQVFNTSTSSSGLRPFSVEEVTMGSNPIVDAKVLSEYDV